MTRAAESPGRLYVLRIEIDGHFHGSGHNVPRPWVARIGGPHARYGLERHFVQPMNDWKKARRACSGNLYGVVSTFTLREGELYECSRLRGNSSRRHIAREFYVVGEGKRRKLDVEEALGWLEREDERPAALYRLTDDESRPRLAEVVGLGTPAPLAFVILDGTRQWLTREGAIYEVSTADGARRLALCERPGRLRDVSEVDAIAWLQRES